METLKAILDRRSVRKYTGEKIPREKLETLARADRVILIILLIFMFLNSNGVITEAKRAPSVVKPVIYNEIKYTADKFLRTFIEKDNGYVEAWDVTTGEKLWEVEVFDSCLNASDGLDNWIEITNLEIIEGMLIVKNQEGEEYEINLNTKQVRKK